MENPTPNPRKPKRARAASTAPAYAMAVDVRLVSAVQSNAGAQCHSAAGLIQAYYIWIHAYRMAVDAGRTAEADADLAAAQAAEGELRRFLLARRLAELDVHCGPLGASAVGWCGEAGGLDQCRGGGLLVA